MSPFCAVANLLFSDRFFLGTLSLSFDSVRSSFKNDAVFLFMADWVFSSFFFLVVENHIRLPKIDMTDEKPLDRSCVCECECAVAVIFTHRFGCRQQFADSRSESLILMNLNVNKHNSLRLHRAVVIFYGRHSKMPRDRKKNWWKDNGKWCRIIVKYTNTHTHALAGVKLSKETKGFLIFFIWHCLVFSSLHSCLYSSRLPQPYYTLEQTDSFGILLN